MPVNSNTRMRLSIFYTIFFLYFEPLAALGGTYLTIFRPARFLEGTVPLTALPASYADISPLTQLLLTNIGALYAMFALNEGIVLRLTKERSVWLTVIGGMAVCDIGHIYAVYNIDPSRMLDLLAWNSDEWINYGTLMLGFTLRVAFLVGVGRN